MNQPAKLDTIAPSLRGAIAPATKNAAAATVSTSAIDGLDGISISTGRSSLGSSQQPIDISVDKTAKASLAFFSIQHLLPVLPGWTVSLAGHIVLLILLGVVATNPLRDGSELRLDGIMVDASPNPVVEDMFNAVEQTDVDLLNVDVAALNSEASAETAEIIRDDGFDVSLMEGMSDGIGLEAMAQSGLTPIATTDEGGVQGETEGTKTQFFGTEASGSRFVFIIDASDSMNEGYRWHQALDELEKSIDQLTEDQQVLVLLYNFQTFPMFDLAPNDLKLLTVSDKFKTALNKWLEDQVPIGGTRPAHALSYSLSLKPDAIFLLSDGMLADNSIQVLAKENRARNRRGGDFSKIPVHTISLGPSEDGAELMKFIAEHNNGDFNWVR
jgi:hypothetical protein